jgi:tripartite-type tricarboxylate transporter receptor subunit TctC
MILITRVVAVVSLALALICQGSIGASAQTYPERTVKIIVPLGAGSGVDISARLLAERLSARWGKPVIIENRPGGDGLIAINAFIAANDPYTLLFSPVAILAALPYQHDDLPYNLATELAPVAGVSSVILALSTSKATSVQSLREMLDRARENPGKYNWATGTGAPDFLMSGFLKSKNLQMNKVPYRDIVQAPADLVQDRIQLLSSSLAIVTPFMQSGQIKVLAVTSRNRAPSAPDVPTVREDGYPELEMESTGGIFGPRNMPIALRERIAEDIRIVAANDTDMAAKLTALGQVVDVRSTSEFENSIKDLNDKLATVAKVLGIKPAH